MNFDYSDEQRELKANARRVFEKGSSLQAVRTVLEGEAPFERALWAELGRLGWAGAVIPEAYGGQGLDYVSYCAFVEELGRALAAVPLSTSAFLAAEALLLAGTDAQKREHLPGLARGQTIGTVALVEEAGELAPDSITTKLRKDRLYGVKIVVSYGLEADLAIVVARDPDHVLGQYLVSLTAPGVRRSALKSFDPTRPLARLDFDGASCEPLGPMSKGWSSVERLLDRASVLTAFEQLGGADKCLELSRDYALLRQAFGRPIGSFQAIKHKLVDVYVANEMARSTAYYGAWALDSSPEEIGRAAAVARLASTQAFETASREFIQVSGGIANTWAHDAHLYYRRSRFLAVQLGAVNGWRDRLAKDLEGELVAMSAAGNAAA